MAQKLIECEHCHGEKICRADHGRSCEVCRRAVGLGRRGAPKNVRCSYCNGRGRIWVEVEEAEEESVGGEEEAKGDQEEVEEQSEES